MRVYRSKVDLPLFVTLAVVPLVLVVAILAGVTDEPHALVLVLGIALTILLPLFIWTLLSTSYTIDSTSLIVRSGPFRWTICLREIRSVTPTRDARSAPALSLERLRIEYGADRSLMVSPREPEAFIRDLEHGRQQPLKVSPPPGPGSPPRPGS
jgi:hypothetical protein